MFSFHNQKKKRAVSLVIIGILIAAMLLSTVAYFLG